jgi:TonB family protein
MLPLFPTPQKFSLHLSGRYLKASILLKAAILQLCLAACWEAMAAPQDRRPPLSKDEVHDMLASHQPSKEIVARINRYGIDFQPKQADLEAFRRAGADSAVLAALRQGWHPAIIKPLTEQDLRMLVAADAQDQSIVRMVRERGIDFHPAADFLEELRKAGAPDDLLSTLRVATPRPFSQPELLQLLGSNMDQEGIARQVAQCGIDFGAGAEELQALRNAGAKPSLLEAVRNAPREKPFVAQTPSFAAGSPLVQGHTVALMCGPGDKQVPVLADPHDLGNVTANLGCGTQVTFLARVESPAGFDKIEFGADKQGFVPDAYLESPMATPGGDITAPVPISQPEPSYTPQAQRDQLEGTVKFYIVVDAQGNVADIQQTSPRLGDGLDERARDTVKTWKFKPATRGGVAIPVRVEVDVSFRRRPNPNGG